MTDLRERVARAICRASYDTPGSWEKWLPEADAAIAEMVWIEPAGWKLVPEKPTDKMLKACGNALNRYIQQVPEADKLQRYWHKGPYGWQAPVKEKFVARYVAMLAAAPTPPAAAEEKATHPTPESGEPTP